MGAERPAGARGALGEAERFASGWMAVACAIGAAAVAAGAFGAHALEASLEPRALQHWETAARYAMFHVPPLLAVSALAAGQGESARRASRAGVAFTLGVALFSGSLWLLALTGVRKLGMITPLGGLSFLAGWGLLAWAATARPAADPAPATRRP